MKFTKFISFPIRRLKVNDSILPDFQKMLESTFAIRGLRGIASDALLARLAEEAYHRAAKDEADGIPRYGQMDDELDQIVRAVEVLWAGKEAGDTAIDAILVHHGVKRPGTIRR